MPGSPESLIPESLVAPGQSPEAVAVYADWSDLVQRIRSGESEGIEELYQLFAKAIRFYLSKTLGPQELDDKVHETFVIVVQAVRRGELQDPQRLMGFVRTVVRRLVAGPVEKTTAAATVADWHRSPKEAAVFREREDLVTRVLAELSGRDREILTRFYIREQSQEQICSEMSLTETQFRLLKSRAKARFGELGKRVFHRRRAGDEPGLPGSDEASRISDHSVEIRRILPVVAHAVAVFGDEAKASHWLTTRLPLLGDRSPSQLLEREDGPDLIEQILTRIEHNIPS